MQDQWNKGVNLSLQHRQKYNGVDCYKIYWKPYNQLLLEEIHEIL